MTLPFTYKRKRTFQILFIHIEREEYRYALFRVTGDYKELIFEALDLAILLPHLTKRYPLVIHVRGTGVLSRTIEPIPNYLDQLLVGGNRNDFYINSLEQEQSCIVSFVRKSSLTELLETFQSNGISIWYLFIGPVLQGTLLSDTTIAKSDFLVTKEPNGDFKLTKSTEPLSEKRINESYIDAFQTFYQTTEPAYNLIQGIEEQELVNRKKEFKDANQFKIIGITLLAFFLISLTGNYFYVNYLNQQVADKEGTLSVYGQNLSLISRLEQEKQRKVMLLDNSGIGSNQYLSYYLDQIGHTVPKNIQLTFQEIYPLEEALKPKQRVNPDKHTILIEGLSENSMTLDKWISHLETFRWVGSVEVLNFTRLSSAKSTFKLAIHLNKS